MIEFKPKHYGLVTSLAAVVITVLPVGVFVLIGRSPLLDERRADTKPSAALQELMDSAAENNAVDARVAHVATPVKTAPSSPRFVPLPFSGDTFSAPLTARTSTDPESKTSSSSAGSAATISDSTGNRSGFRGHSGWAAGGMDLSERIASSDVKAIKPRPVDPVPTPVEPPPSERLFPPAYGPMTTTVGEATGHQLQSSSMAGGSLMPFDNSMTTGTSSKPSMDRLKKRKPTESSASLMAAAMEPPEEETSVEMILKNPVESRRARRVENVLAFTNETGWPIAMVRSDLPDSRWWVQQMTAIRGNAFSRSGQLWQ